jgi:hypothetical protein
MNSFTLHCKKSMNSYIVQIHICMNSCIWNIEFIEYINLYIIWLHTFYNKRKKINPGFKLLTIIYTMPHHHRVTWQQRFSYNIYTVCIIWFSWVRKWRHKTNCIKSHQCHITNPLTRYYYKVVSRDIFACCPLVWNPCVNKRANTAWPHQTSIFLSFIQAVAWAAEES